MPPHALDHRLQRILRVRDDLHTLDRRVQAADCARQAAIDTFERARAVMEEASEEATGLHLRQQTLRDQLDALRRSFICDSVASLPADVLRCIFEEVVALPQSMLKSAQLGRSYRKDYALAPFRLAAAPCSLDNVWSLVLAAAPTLESLTLGHTFTLIPGVGAVFPKLKSLLINEVDDDTIISLSNAQMPLLEEFAVGSGTIDVCSPLLQRISSSVHTLSLLRDIDQSDIHALRFLTSVRTLRVTGTERGNPRIKYTISDDFFVGISLDVWPKLVSVQLSPAGTFKLGDYGFYSFEDVVGPTGRRCDGDS
ncbi:hypothetical protein AURDEDRAFT_187165 [Auricularia subglabra TFB-10046 SS5]|nr:hypothetical protein AURDEDRAFT_187165 [Auricularia subglabra TFB-10046 SS5]